ncbi:hypothetical protein GEV29_01515 [Aeromicrobium sp. SMF47]|uniref:Uncharacterized protein n=1 Tax=Aeromicrobium yanjiei TaxID=2662028 RepID=A0A5Q2MF16_9ACTN|nr:hypothetical protein [Aeromicrobium yanjiei]MRJ75207.1 hypothetical protein [Aeromicrobium yanjiei]QGG40343.1 hypothetical protein GEV26_02570 [Aeromicrobium yanjiei]
MEHTTRSRGATMAAALLVLVQLLRGGLTQPETYIEVLLMALVLMTTVAAYWLHRSSTWESRLVLGLMAAVSGAGAALTSTIGLPGQDVQTVSPLGVLVLALSIAVIGLLVADRPRTTAGPDTRSPYAS